MICESIIVNGDRDVGYWVGCDCEVLSIRFEDGLGYGIFWVAFFVVSVYVICEFWL